MTPNELEETAKAAQRELKAFEERSSGGSWLVGEEPSAADVAIYPFVATFQRATTKAEAAGLRARIASARRGLSECPPLDGAC
jgi:glutathione S-transferase